MNLHTASSAVSEVPLGKSAGYRVKIKRAVFPEREIS
jgi:hypothetical protein